MRTIQLILLGFLLLFAGRPTVAADYYWVNGTGNWSDFATHWATTSGGSTYHLSAPTLNDNVFFDANSFTAPGQIVTVDAAATCLNMNWTGALNNPQLTGTNTIEIYGSFTLIPAMTFTLSSNLQFKSPLMGNTINFAGVPTATLWGVQFEGTGGWTLLSDIDISAAMGSLQHSGGTLNTNGFNFSCGMINSWFNIIPRTFILGSSTITCNNFMVNPGADLTFNAGTSKIIIAQNWFNGGGLTYYDVAFTPAWSGEVNIQGENTFNVIDISSSFVTGVRFESNKTNQLFGLITGAGCDRIKTVSSTMTGQQATIKKISGNITLDFLAIRDIRVVGGATFVTNNGVNMGNVTNWTINSSPAGTLYWVGGTGNWEDTEHWSTVSGGAYPSSYSCVPGINDNVVFDNNSFGAAGESVTVNGAFYCRNMDWSGVTNNPSFTTSWQNSFISGSLTLSPNMTVTLNGTWNFTSNAAGTGITTAGHSLNIQSEFNGNGTWTFNDNFTSTSGITHEKGNLVINDKSIQVPSYTSVSNETRSMTITSGSFTTNYWSIDHTGNYTFNSGLGTINLNGTYFMSNGFHYNNLILNSTSYTNLYGSNEFMSITNPGRGDIIFEAGVVNNIASFSCDGTCGRLVSIRSSQPGTQAEFYKLGGNVTVSYCQIKDILASGTAVFTANNSVNMGNNSNWTFNALASTDYYWIGGSGNWNDPAHWSLSSGGVANPGGCIPTMVDNVFFNGASGLGGATVTINVEAFCKNFSHTANNSILSGTSVLNVYGSFTLNNTLNVNGYTGNLYFRAETAGNTINTAGRTLRGHVYFEGVGSWTLQAAFATLTSTNKNIYFRKGTLSTANFNMTTHIFYSNVENIRVLNLGSSTITANQWQFSNPTGLTINAGTSTLTIASTFYGGNQTYNNVNIQAAATVTVYGNNTYNNLNIPNCTRLNFEKGTTHTFNAITFPNGTGCNTYFDVSSNQPGIPAQIVKNGAAITKDWLRITDVKASGAGACNATNSIGIGDYTGWNITGSGSVNYYWIGGTGNWNDPAHWSLTSGGVPNPPACIPDADDNVFFDANSFLSVDQVVTINATAYCANINWTGVVNNPKLSGFSSIYITGSITYVPGMTVDYSGYYYMMNNGGVSITSAGHVLTGLILNGSGICTLNDDITLSYGGITLNNGVLNTNNKNVYSYNATFNSSSTSLRTLELGSSKYYCNGWYITDGTNLTINPGTSEIYLVNDAWTFNGGGKTYYNVYIEKYPWGYMNFDGSNSFNVLFFEPGSMVSFKEGSTQTTLNLVCYGNASEIIDFQSAVAGSPFHFVQTSVFCSDWLKLKDCDVSGSTFYAGVHSTDLGGNSGWTWSGVTANDQYPAFCENVPGSGVASGINLLTLNGLVSGGAPGHVHVWFNDPGLTSPVLTPANVSATNGQMFYDLVSNGTCQNVAVALITVNSKPLISFIPENPLCHGNSNGQIDAIVTSGMPAYSYLWSNGATTEDISGLIVGNYSLTVTDHNGCANTGSVALSEPDVLAVSETHTHVTCFGLCNGTISINVTGGTAPYLYSWSGPSGYTSAAEDISGLCQGTYNLTVTDFNSCTTTLTVIITEPALLTATSIITNATCSGICNGSISISPSGGTAPYGYSWTGPSGYSSALEDINALCAGTYNVTITDVNSCTFSAAYSVTEPLPVSFTETHTSLTCNGVCTGYILVTPAGGTPPLTINWSTGSTAFEMTSLCAGTYTGTITDANLCTAIVTITLTEPTPLVVTPTVSNSTCPGSCSGAISLNVSGGTPPYNYSWSGLGGTYTSASQNLSGLCPGTYDLTVTDFNGCTFTASYTITEPAAWMVNETALHVLCSGACSGSIDVTVSGATSPYTFAWSGPGGFTSVNEDISSLCAGAYDVTISDAVACTYITSININEPAFLEITSHSSTNITCNGMNDGSVTVNATGGVAPMNYNIGSGNQLSGSFTGLSAGNYIVTVTDANGCTAVSTTFTIINPPALTIVSETFTNISCNGNANGTITVVASGGSTPLMYSISAVPQPNGIFTGLSEGNYTVTVTDMQGCTITSNLFTISEPVAITIDSETSTDLLCFNGNDGAITVTASGGTGGLTYNLGAGTQPSGNFTALAAGTYQVTVTDNNGCTQTSSSFVLSQPTQILLSETHTDVTVCGASDGTITLTVSGGTPTYTYAWTGPSGFTAATQNLTGLEGGIYQVLVSDNNLCTATLSVSVNETGAPMVTAVLTQNNCFGNCAGIIATTVTGGLSPFTFVWSNSMSDDTISGLCADTYYLTVSDAAGCDAYFFAEITEPDSITATVITTNETCYALCNGTAAINASGGTLPYSFDIGSGAQPANSFNALCPGTYTVTITDAGACTQTVTFEIYEYTIDVNIAVVDISCYGLCDGIASITVNGTTGPYTYEWSNSEVTFVIANLCDGDYFLTVTDAGGCETLDTAVVTMPDEMVVAMSSTDDFGSGDGTATASVTGGTAGYTYLWSPGGQTTATISGLPAGTYTVTVTDSNGCIVIETVEVLLNVGLTEGGIEASIQVYPNPFHDILHVSIENLNENVVITITDISGRQVYRKEEFPCKTIENHIYFENQAEGMYFLRITGNKTQHSSKMILR